MDRLDTKGTRLVRIHFEERHGSWRQGVRLKCNGQFRVNEQLIPGKDGIVLWEDTAPRSVDIELCGSIDEVRVYNVWDTGNGVIEAWHNGAAMIIEELPTGRRYRCNDGNPDARFDDIVFSVELGT